MNTALILYLLTIAVSIAIGVIMGRWSKQRECEETMHLRECEHHVLLLQAVIQAKRCGAAAERLAAGTRAVIVVNPPRDGFRAEAN